jgi:two-component system response regulator AtoC
MYERLKRCALSSRAAGGIMSSRILIVEDEKTALHALSSLLGDEGYKVIQADRGEQGLRLAASHEPDLILLDIRLPDFDGLSLLERLRANHNDAAVIIMTADTTSQNAIRATQLGAFDYVSKPINDDHLLVQIRRALEYRKLEHEVRSLRSIPENNVSIPGMVGHSLQMQEVYKLIGRVANSQTTVLICGESGTGKELVANAIHEFSDNRNGPLVKVNCAAIPENLLEAELFGHEKGAFTNALMRRIGRFEQSQNGSLFLDEIAELPLTLQAKLLRAIQERTIERLGSNTPVHINARFIAATAQDLDAQVAAGRFREDLYYRLNVVSISLPPLRQRKEDIPLLVQRFLSRSQRTITMGPDALDKIMTHHWPGNVRELENVIARAIVLAPGEIITPDSIQISVRSASTNATDWLDQVPVRDGYWHNIRKLESHLVKAALEQAKGNKAEAARILGVQRRLLYEKMSEIGLGVDEGSSSR